MIYDKHVAFRQPDSFADYLILPSNWDRFPIKVRRDSQKWRAFRLVWEWNLSPRLQAIVSLLRGTMSTNPINIIKNVPYRFCASLMLHTLLIDPMILLIPIPFNAPIPAMKRMVLNVAPKVWSRANLTTVFLMFILGFGDSLSFSLCVDTFEVGNVSSSQACQ